MALRSLLPFFIVFALVSCGKEALPEKPQLLTDRDSIVFGQAQGSNGTYLGTSPQESLRIDNQGLNNLVISSATLGGDAAFTVDPPISDVVVKGKGYAFVRMFFTPQAAKVYSATLTIQSNAENAPTKLISISGRGILRPDGGP